MTRSLQNGQGPRHAAAAWFHRSTSKMKGSMKKSEKVCDKSIFEIINSDVKLDLKSNVNK